MVGVCKGFVGGLLGWTKVLLEASNTSKIVTTMGIKICTADTGVYGSRMVLKRRLLIHR